MAILISAHSIGKTFGARPLFEGLDFVLETGDRVGLIGPNGAGKSTLLRVLSGEIGTDAGNLSSQRGLRVGYLEQLPTIDDALTVEENILKSAVSEPKGRELMAKLSLTTGTVTPEQRVGNLSGGWKKRVALARELAKEPDLLLLDEPTNHLDVESILWLEGLIARAPFAVLTVTHDRLFLQRIANRILELDKRHPNGLLDVRGDYATYLERKELAMQAQEQRESALKNRLRRETEWLRRGAKARTTKQQARIKAAGDLKDEVEDLAYRNDSKSVRLDFGALQKQPKRLVEAKAISKSFGENTLFKGLNLWIGPGSRIGLLGANGCGKSTLIRILMGQEEPDGGTIFRSEHLTPAYFEQTRESLDPELTLMKTLAPGGDSVNYRGRLIHVRSYLDRFLFRAEQMEMKVGRLSGGEQSRLLIARLMLREANLLVLDEPTNDLDIDTLDVLEDCLEDFPGAVLLVTHDRYFLDQITDEILAFEPEGIVSFAGLAQWEAWRAERKKKPEAPKATDAAKPKDKKKKLGYLEQRELAGMEATIEKAETKLADLQAQAELPENVSSSTKLTEIYQAVASAQAEVERLYARWEELEAQKE